VSEVPFTYDDPNAQWATETRMADAIVNLSGYPIACYWTDARRRKLQASRVDTTNALVKQIAATPRGIRPRVFVSASAVGIYGESHERILTEGSPLGDDFLATLALDWEEAARGAEEFGCRVVRIRTGIVLGSEGILPRMLLPARLLMGGPIGDGRQWVSWVHVADIAGLYRFALEHAHVTGALNACAPAPVRMGILSAELGRVIHRPSWLRIPVSTLELVLGDVAQYTVMSERMSAEKALACGYEFRFPKLGEALQDLVGRPTPAEQPAAAATATVVAEEVPAVVAADAAPAPAATEVVVAASELSPSQHEATEVVVAEVPAEENVSAEAEAVVAQVPADAEVAATKPPDEMGVAPEEATKTQKQPTEPFDRVASAAEQPETLPTDGESSPKVEELLAPELGSAAS